MSSEEEYRGVTTGELGFREPGSDRIRVKKRDGSFVYRTFIDMHWVRQDDERLRRLTPAEVAKIAFAADQALIEAIQHYEFRADWSSMRDRERAAWIQKGPVSGPSVRRKMYLAVQIAVRELTGG